MNTEADKQTASRQLQKRLLRVGRAVPRIMAALITMALGCLIGLFGFGLVWSVWDTSGKPPGVAPDYYWIQIGSISLDGWKIYACAVASLVAAAACIGLGLSLLRKPGSAD